MTLMMNNAGANRLRIEYESLDRLQLDPKNPRIHPPAQIGKIAKSIQSFGFGVPVLIDAHYNVLAGHGRIAAARQLGMDELPVVRLDHLSPTQAKAFQIADNRLCELGGWNEAVLAETLKTLTLEPLAFDLTATGFELPEIDLKIQGLQIGPGDGEPDPDDAPGDPGPSICRSGDLWRLEAHRIFCGDALDASSYEALLGEELAAAVFTDPPYNVRVQGHVGGRGRIKHREFAMASGEMSEEAFATFLHTTCAQLTRFSRPGAIVFTCMDWRHITLVLAAGERAFGELKNLCVWAKTAAGQGAFYRSQHELVAVFKRTGGAHTNNVQLGRFGRNRSNLWTYPSPARFGGSGEEGSLLSEHPTPKPVAMVADALMDVTTRGEIVLDAFLGGGATLIAAERTGRTCRGLEIDPGYVDVAIRRWMRLSGKDAVRDSDGALFSVLQEEAERHVR